MKDQSTKKERPIGLTVCISCVQVMWVEHMEMVGEEKQLHHVLKDYVAGGAAFGATRWVSLLQRQCERLASELARNIADLGGILGNTNIHTTWLLMCRRRGPKLYL
jgi:hypothetical protein